MLPSCALLTWGVRRSCLPCCGRPRAAGSRVQGSRSSPRCRSSARTDDKASAVLYNNPATAWPSGGGAVRTATRAVTLTAEVCVEPRIRCPAHQQCGMHSPAGFCRCGQVSLQHWEQLVTSASVFNASAALTTIMTWATLLLDISEASRCETDASAVLVPTRNFEYC